MIPSFATAGVLTAPSGALIASGYIPGNTLAAQNLNWYLNHLTMEINAVLTAGGVAQNSAVDTQLQSSIVNQILSLGGQGYLAKNSGSPYNLSLATLYGTVDVTAGGSAYVVKLPDAATAYALGYEVDIRKADAGAGYVTVQLQTAANYLANVLNGSWDVTEQYGHVRLRAIPVLGGYGYAVESCDGTVYRNVITSSSTVAATAGTWYNQGGSITLAPGIYELSWSATLTALAITYVSATLSTGNNSETDKDFSSSMTIASSTWTLSAFRIKRVVLAAGTTYFLNITANGNTTIGFQCGTASNIASGNIRIEAKRVA